MNRDVKLLFGILLIAAGIISLSIFTGMESREVEQPASLAKNTAVTSPQDNQAAVSPPQKVTTATSPSSVTSSELAKHNQLDDCWVAYSGKVYDMTYWLPRHPGSAGAILPYCGTSTEFENKFNRQHGSKRASWIIDVATFMGYFENKGALIK